MRIVRVPARPSRVKDIFNAEHTKERLRTAQPAREGAGIYRPARAFFRDVVTGKSGGGTQKVLRQFPPQLPRSAMSFRTQTTTGSASMIPSTAAWRLAS